MLEFLLISDDFDCHNLTSLVVNTLQGLPERAFSEKLNDLKSVGNVVLKDNIVVTSFIVISVIVLLLLRPFDLFRAQAQEVANFVVEDFAFLVLC